MPTFTFTLIVEGPDLQADETIDALFEAGCRSVEGWHHLVVD